MRPIVSLSSILPVMACAFCLGGCAIPMAVITQRGETFRGTETYNGPGTEAISMSNGKTTCSSDPGGISVFHCSDGRTGIVNFTNCTDKGGGARAGECGSRTVRKAISLSAKRRAGFNPRLLFAPAVTRAPA
jgi:hypothetical protein